MAIEGLDAGLPIENAGFRPQAGIPETPEANAGPTLDDALRQVARAEGPAAFGPDTLLDREAMRQAAAPDLWIEDTTLTAYRALNTGGAGALAAALAERSQAVSIDPNASGDSGYIIRELSIKELKLLAGGWGTTGVTVVGPDPYWDPTLPNDPNPDGGYGGNGGSGRGGQPEPVANDTPCVEAAPAGVPLQEINNKALAASNAIAALNDETYEYAVIIWALNGVVGYTTPYTDHLADEVNWAGHLSEVPTGAVIVGIVHNHPDDPSIEDEIPSGAGRENGEDWDSYNALVNYNRDNNPDLPRGITVDPNMLLYIYTNETEKTRVYDKTDKSQTNPSCSLQ